MQVKELKDSFEGLEKEGKGHKTLKPDRVTRAQSREVVSEEAEPVEEEEGKRKSNSGHTLLTSIAVDAAPPDPRSFAEPEDIMPKLPSSFQANLKSSKWKERKEALDDLLTVITNTPRIKDASELSELSRSLATCVAKDANINCVMLAANAVEGLAKGVMSPFSKYREVVIPLMLERLKERKANVTDVIGAAIDAVFNTVSGLSDFCPLRPQMKCANRQRWQTFYRTSTLH